MFIHGFTLALALALQSPAAPAPEPAAEPPAATPAADPSAVPQEAASPPAAPAAPAPAPAKVRPVPRYRGTFALVLGSLSAVTGLGLGLAAAREIGYCSSIPTGCLDGPVLLPALAYSFDFLAVLNLSIGGTLRGRWEGRRDRDRQVQRDRSLFIPAGAVIVGAGGVMALGGYAWLATLDEGRGRGDPFALMQVGITTVAAGAGLLAYGTAYRRNIVGRGHARVLPGFGPGFAGLTVAGRF